MIYLTEAKQLLILQDEGIDETYGIPVQFDNYEEEGDGEDVYGEVGGGINGVVDIYWLVERSLVN